MLKVLPQPATLKQTTSRCPACLAPIPADVVLRGGRVEMHKTCPQHGEFVVPLSSDRRYYHNSRGAAGATADCSPSCGCATTPANRASAAPAVDPFETLSTCIALIEIVDSCNLTCPTCYASSPWTAGGAADGVPFEGFVSRVAGVLDRKGFIDILQLSGGEPTLHPEFFRLLEWSLREPRIGYVLLNTNAVRIATDEAFRARLIDARRQYGKFELYMQFDGPASAGQVELRGADLREIRRRAIDLAGEGGVPTTLAMTVTPANVSHLGDTLRFGLERPHCRGITFQPMFHSGRLPAGNWPPHADSGTARGNFPSAHGNLPSAHGKLTSAHGSPSASHDNPPQATAVAAHHQALPIHAAAPAHLSVADLIASLVAQSAGLLSDADFTPLPCGDPNCHTIGYLLRSKSGPVGLSRLVDLKSMQGFLGNRVDYRIEDLARCGCDSEPLGRVIKSLEISPDQPFRLFIKPFMDAWTYDQDRIDRCCTHVIRRDGKLDSFCRYYLLGGAAPPAQREPP